MVQRRPKTGPAPKGKKIRWVARYYDPSGRERHKSFPTKREAEAHEEEQHRLMRRSEWIDADGAPTLEELWPLWERAATNPGTRSVRELVGKNLGDLAATKITRIRPTQLRTWQAQLAEGRPWSDGTPLAPNTRKSWWTQLSGCLTMAVTDELLLVNPCSKVHGPTVAAEAVDPRTLPTMDQVHDAITTADDCGRDTLATMLILMVGTGLRPGEAGGLRWRSVDGVRSEIHVVEQSLQRPPPGGSPWGPPKTKGARRVVPVPPSVMTRLRKHRLRHPCREDEAMFSTPTGKIWTSDLLVKAVKVVNADAGWTPHALRHVFATQMLTAGRSIKAVQKILGHSSAGTTIDTYWHVLPDETEMVRDSADDLVRAICGQPVGGAGTPTDGVPAKIRP